MVEADRWNGGTWKCTLLRKPRVVLLDLVMNGMYGLDVLTKLREMDHDARIIIASADIQSSTRTTG